MQQQPKKPTAEQIEKARKQKEKVVAGNKVVKK
jgi:hypothetical protein